MADDANLIGRTVTHLPVVSTTDSNHSGCRAGREGDTHSWGAKAHVNADTVIESSKDEVLCSSSGDASPQRRLHIIRTHETRPVKQTSTVNEDKATNALSLYIKRLLRASDCSTRDKGHTVWGCNKPRKPFMRDGRLYLFEYQGNEEAFCERLVAEAFFFGFFLLYLGSIVFWPICLWALLSGYRPHSVLSLILLLCSYTYILPPKFKQPATLNRFLFYAVPFYFRKGASWQFTHPETMRETRAILASMNAERSAQREEKLVEKCVLDLGSREGVSGVEGRRVLDQINVKPVSESSLTHPLPQEKIHPSEAQCDVLANPRRRLNPRVFLYHPHALFPSGWGLLAFCTYLPNLLMGISTALYLTPPLICATSHCGTTMSVRHSAIKKALQSGRDICLIPGGFEEATIHPNIGDRLYLKSKKGIFKYAIQFGAEVIPIFGFGEAMAYRNCQYLLSLRLKLNQLSIPAILPWGRKFIPWMPKPNSCLHVVVGKPINANRSPIENPPREAVVDLHRKYIQQIEQIHRQFSVALYGDENSRLEIW